MREIKFRGWLDGEMHSHKDLVDMDQETHAMYTIITHKEQVDGDVFMQYTGLKDKNGYGCNEVYEGDVITVDGKVRGNIYEIEPRETDIVIPPIGTKSWNSTYKKAVERGFDYSE